MMWMEVIKNDMKLLKLGGWWLVGMIGGEQSMYFESNINFSISWFI